MQVRCFCFQRLLFNFVNAYLFAVSAKAFESYSAVNLRVESVIRADADIGAGMDVSASLPYKDVACKNKLTVRSLDAETLGLGIAAVTG